MLYLSESLNESTEGAENPASDSPEPSDQNQAAVMSDTDVLHKEPEVSEAVVEPPAAPCGNADPAAAETSAQQPAKPKKDKLAILKKLGLDPPPVAKLCPDKGAFVDLEPPQPNPGKNGLFQDFSRVRNNRDQQ